MHVYQPSDSNFHKYRSGLDDSFTLHEIRYPRVLCAIKSFLAKNRRILRYGGNSVTYLLESFFFVIACYRKCDRRGKNIFIGGDPQGLLAAWINHTDRKDVLIYWSLELWVAKDIKGIAQKIFKRIEKACNRKALYTIEFGEKRCEILQHENSLPPGSMIAIPNSPMGEAKITRGHYFNDRFDIPADKTIVLFAGGISSDHMLLEVIDSTESWPLDSVLVLHIKKHDSRRIFELQQHIRQRRIPIYLSLEPVSYFDLERIYSSADIGLQFFRPRITNLKYADLSSGKLFHYMRAGVPVIANNLYGYKNLIEKNGFGVCVSEMTEIGSAIRKIVENKHAYQENCVSTFMKFKFRDHHRRIEENVTRAVLERM